MRVTTIGLTLALASGACGEDAEIPLLDPRLGSGGTSGANSQLDSGVDAASGDASIVTPCASSASCIGTEKFCDVASGRCVECLVSSQCDVDKGCGPNGTCEEVCVIDDDCSSGSSPFCLPGFLVCVECKGDIDCDDLEQPFCEPSTKECVECLVAGHCEPDKTCDPVEFQCEG